MKLRLPIFLLFSFLSANLIAATGSTFPSSLHSVTVDTITFSSDGSKLTQAPSGSGGGSSGSSIYPSTGTNVSFPQGFSASTADFSGAINPANVNTSSETISDALTVNSSGANSGSARFFVLGSGNISDISNADLKNVNSAATGNRMGLGFSMKNSAASFPDYFRILVRSVGTTSGSENSSVNFDAFKNGSFQTFLNYTGSASDNLLRLPASNLKLTFGTANQSAIYYNGTNLVINPNYSSGGNLVLQTAIININGVDTNWPSANSAGALTNDGSGNFSYVVASAGAGSSIAVSTNGTTISTAPTKIDFIPPFKGNLSGATTVQVSLDYSSVTLQGNSFNGANQLNKLDSNAFVPNANIDPSSVTKLGNIISLNTETSGNYAASVNTTAPLSGGSAGSAAAALTLDIDRSSFTLLGPKVDLNSSSEVTGTLAVGNMDTTSTGVISFSSAATNLVNQAVLASTFSTNYYIKQNFSGTSPINFNAGLISVYSTSLSTGVTGTLPFPNLGFQTPARISATYTTTSSDTVIAATTPANAATGYKITLKQASTVIGQILTIKKVDFSTISITIGVTGSDKIDGSTDTIYLTSAGQTLVVQSRGNDGVWDVLEMPVTPAYVGGREDPNSATSVGTSSNTVYAAYSVPYYCAISSLAIVVSAGAGPTGNIQAGIWDQFGNVVATTAVVSSVSLGNGNKAFIALSKIAYLRPGIYYLGITCSNTTVTFTKIASNGLLGVGINTSTTFGLQPTLTLNQSTTFNPIAIAGQVVGSGIGPL